jgi:hypothetical protein
VFASRRLACLAPTRPTPAPFPTTISKKR